MRHFTQLVKGGGNSNWLVVIFMASLAVNFVVWFEMILLSKCLGLYGIRNFSVP